MSPFQSEKTHSVDGVQSHEIIVRFTPVLKVAAEHQAEAMRTIQMMRDAVMPIVVKMSLHLPGARVIRDFDLARHEARARLVGLPPEAPHDRIEIRFAPRGEYSLDGLAKVLDAAADVYASELHDLESELAANALPPRSSRPSVKVLFDLSETVIKEHDEEEEPVTLRRPEVGAPPAPPPARYSPAFPCGRATMQGRLTHGGHGIQACWVRSVPT